MISAAENELLTHGAPPGRGITPLIVSSSTVFFPKSPTWEEIVKDYASANNAKTRV
jgi:hypothetical protein